MPYAFVDAAELEFPAQCLGCGAPAATLYTLQARRGIDVIVVELWEFTPIRFPVCVACRKRRRLAGFATFGAYLLILPAVALAAYWAFDGQIAAAWILGAAVTALVLTLRFASHWLMDWVIFGIRAKWLGGPGTRLRITLRRDGYFGEWIGLNPSATFSPDGRRPGPPRVLDASFPPFVFNRTMPVLGFVLCVATLAFHHWYAMRHRRMVMPAGVLALPALALLALGGIAYPPIFFAIGKDGRRMPLWIKVCASALGIAGLAIGGYLAFVVYAFPRRPR